MFLAWLMLGSSGPARAGAPHEVGLDVVAGYRGIDRSSPVEDATRHDLVETIEATYDGYLVDRAFAAFHLGFALDHRSTWREGRRDDLFALRYDARLDLWKDEILPVSVYATRQVADAMQGDVPGNRMVTETYGYTAAFAPRRLPRIQSSGLLRSFRGERAGDLDRIVTTDVNGELVHTDERLLVRAGVARRVTSRLESQRREVIDADLYADYQLDRNTDVVARAWSRSYETTRAGERTRLGTQYSDAVLRLRPAEAWRGTAFYRVRRTSSLDVGTDERAVGTQWLWTPRPWVGLTLRGGAAATSAAPTATDPDALEPPPSRETQAEYLGSNVLLGHVGRGGEVRVSAQAGVAGIQDPLAGGGVQAGGGVDAQAATHVGGDLLRLMVAGLAARQWDTSALDQEYLATGWRAGLDTGQIPGMDVHFSVSQRNVARLGEGATPSSQFQAVGRAGARLARGFQLSYTVMLYRDVLGADYASGARHGVRMALRPAPGLMGTVIYAFDRSDSSALDAASFHRVDGTLGYTLGKLQLTARCAWAGSAGRAPESRSLAAWVEVSRSFRWRL